MAPIDFVSSEILRMVFKWMACMSGEKTRWQPSCFPAVALDEAIVDAEEEEMLRVFCEMEDKRRDLSSIIRVCKQWNIQSIGYRELWTNVWITKRTSEDELRGWLARSSPLAVDVTFDFTDTLLHPADYRLGLYGPPSLADRIIGRLSIVHQDFQRCRSLSITLASQFDITAVLEYLSDLSAPAVMEQLRISYISDGVHKVRLSPMTYAFGGKAPSLRRLRLQGIPMSFGCPSLTANLTALVMHTSAGFNLQWDSLVTSLMECPRLEVLTIRNVVCRGISGKRRVDCVALLSLTHLSLGKLGNEFATAFIDLVHVPSLHNLWLDFQGTNSTCFFRRLYAKRASGTALVATVHHLTLVGVFAPDDVNVAVMRQLRSLVSIDLRNALAFFDSLHRNTIDLLDDVLENLCEMPNPDLLCPKLETLFTNGLKGLSVGTFLVARCGLNRSLKEVFVRSGDFTQDEIVVLRGFLRVNEC